MKCERLWDTNYNGWRKEQVEPNYFSNFVYRLVEPKLENEFTVEDFMEKFNKLSPHVRETNSMSFRYVINLLPRYHYSILSSCLQYMVTQNQLKSRYVSVGSRTETFFEKN